jgi:hypothetical protein
MKVKAKMGAVKSAVVGGLAVVGASAHAALPEGVTTQFTSTQADIVEAGGLIIGLAVVAMGIRWVKATFF